ncbi:PilZ domain-containing protein [Yoonia sp. 208BN28-4]|uniref:PilZ domain-containing protein n=1 Tax=Yoonia sp. 208BN28-4 TaxID=3126505 RepID=UPI0030949A56
MRYFHLICCLGFVCAGGSAQAAVDCAVVGGIERIHDAEARLLAASPGPFDPTDLQIIRSEVSRLDSRSISNALRDHPTRSDVDDVQSFWLRASMLDRLAQQPDTGSFEHFLTQADTRKLFARLARVLPNFGCDSRDVTAGTPPNGTDRTGSGMHLTDQARTGLGFHLPASIILTLAFVAGGLALWWWIRFAQKLSQKRKRRRRRYPVNLTSKIKSGHEIDPARIVDLSCMGAKLKCSPETEPSPGDPVAIWLNESWVPAKISWSNHWYCGIQFDRRIRFSRLSRLVGGLTAASKRRAGPKTKAAPEARTPL